jgi:outer membrane biosynthesis protein TonB
MRNILMATLVLAPVLVHAQSQSPSQPRGANAPVLESKLVSPKAVDGSASANVTPLVSNLVQPRLIKWTNIEESQRNSDTPRYSASAVTVSMTISESGTPSDLKIVSSEDPLLNTSVLDAVAHYRFAPGSLNSKPTAIPLVLTVRVLPPTQ